METVPERVRDRVGPGTALLAVSALALLARVWALGWRVAHQDESRVAHWILHYREFGVWEYRPIIHGPFLPHVNGVLFSFVPPSDFSMRLVVAVVGGLLPLVAWLFRERLRDAEVVALGLLLAANPILLYYSRFMRNDLLVAAFMLAALGLYVRAYDERDARYLYAGTLPFALAFTAKELALVYPVSWAGATLLLLDHRLVWATERDDWRGELRDRVARAAVGVWRWRRAFALAALEFLVVLVLFYAPKGTDPGLWSALANPVALPGVVDEALLGSWEKFTETWGGAGGEPYMPYFFALGKVLVAGALALLAFAAAGFVADRYSRNRDAVAFCGYWGVAHLFGIPVAIDNPFPWETIHVVVPLAVPAAVGVALVYRLGRDALADGDTAGAAAAAVLLLLAAGQVGAVAVDTSYVNPQSPDNDLVQFAQPAGEMQSTLERIYAVDRENGDAVDVLFYGEIKETDSGRDRRDQQAGDAGVRR
ncbi:MAG: flippase activity-associated protein Agl23, partial [Halobacteriaceae archaeon]